MEQIEVLKADTCKEETSVTELARVMAKNNLRRCFVVDDKAKLKGVVTTVDIVNKLVATGKDTKKATVKEIMTSDVKYVTTEDEIEKALEIMNSLKTFVCPVVKDEKFMGIVTYQNILNNVMSSIVKDKNK